MEKFKWLSGAKFSTKKEQNVLRKILPVADTNDTF